MVNSRLSNFEVEDPRDSFKYSCMENYKADEDAFSKTEKGTFANQMIEFGYQCWRKGWWNGYHHSMRF